MASICNLVLRPPTAVPAKTPFSGGGLPRSASVTPRAPPLFSTGKSFPRRLKADPSQKFVYPEPIPQFAVAETRKFKAEMLKKLSKEKDTFGSDLHTVVDVCAEILSEFLHTEYEGPGTLLIEPFTEMMVSLKERDLPGAPLAARASLLWAQCYIDQDWLNWNSKPHKP